MSYLKRTITLLTCIDYVFTTAIMLSIWHVHSMHPHIPLKLHCIFCSPVIEPLVVVRPAELFMPELRVWLLHAFGYHEGPDHRPQSHFACILAEYVLRPVFIRLQCEVELFLLRRFVSLALLRGDLGNSFP